MIDRKRGDYCEVMTGLASMELNSTDEIDEDVLRIVVKFEERKSGDVTVVMTNDELVVLVDRKDTCKIGC